MVIVFSTFFRFVTVGDFAINPSIVVQFYDSGILMNVVSGKSKTLIIIKSKTSHVTFLDFEMTDMEKL